MADQNGSLRTDEEQQGERSRSASSNLSRRSLLRRSATVAAVAAPVGLLAACGGRITSATSRVAPAAPAVLPARGNVLADARQSHSLSLSLNAAFQEIQTDENQHVAYLKNALGSAARPVPTFTGLDAPDVATFETLSYTFENVGVGAYLGAAASIKSMATLLAAAGIMDVEARHAGFLGFLTGKSLSPDGAFQKPLTQAQVVTAVSPFVAGVNGGPSPSGTLSSDADILNFALLLEYLESTFYNLNVPKFFGGSTPGNG
ncbi:MAG: ferritin-like domain-containing protein [Ktedonobacterales bacterium]